MKEILKSIPRLESIDAEDAADHVADPEDGIVIFPFTATIHNKTTQMAATASEPAKKGTRKKVQIEQKKYGEKNIPLQLKKTLKKLCKIPQKWRKCFLKTGSASLAKNTWTKYASAYNAYSNFCIQENIRTPWPVSHNATVCFILWCKKNLNLKANSIKSYLSALQTISKLLGLKNQKTAKNSAKLLVRGIERTENQKLVRKTDPLVFEILVALKKIIDNKKWKKQSKNVVWASLCLGYFGSFRANELLTHNQNSFDPSSNCTWVDLNFESESKISVTIKNPKTGGNKPEIVDLFAFPIKNFCPIHALVKLKKSSEKTGCFNPVLPIFRFSSGKFFTTSALSGILRKLLAKSKFKNKRISAKSLRSGVPTDLENNPDLFDDLHIKIWGRWKSNAYQRYMKDDKYQREWIFNKMCKILTPFCF